MKTEWMPVTPCSPTCPQRDGYCPPKGRFGCDRYEEYIFGLFAQRKLLEYLLANMGVGTGMLKSMLNQLEVK